MQDGFKNLKIKFITGWWVLCNISQSLVRPTYIWKGIHHIYEKSYFKSMGGNYLINTRGIIGHSVGEDKNQIRFLPHNIYKLIPEGLKNQVKIF